VSSFEAELAELVERHRAQQPNTTEARAASRTALLRATVMMDHTDLSAEVVDKVVGDVLSRSGHGNYSRNVLRDALLRGFRGTPVPPVHVTARRGLLSSIKRAIFAVRHGGADLNPMRETILKMLDDAAGLVTTVLPFGAGLPPAKLEALQEKVATMLESTQQYQRKKRGLPPPAQALPVVSTDDAIHTLTTINNLLIEALKVTKEAQP